MPSFNLPLLHGNWIDLFIIIILIWFLLNGYGKGFLTGMLDFVAIIFSFLAALKTYSLLSYLLIGNFSMPKGISDAVGFLLAGLISEALFTLLANLAIDHVPKNYLQSALNKLLGIIPSLLNGIIVIAFFLTIILSLPVNPIYKAAVTSSKLGSIMILNTQVVERKLNTIFGQAISDTLNFITVEKGKENISLHFTTANLNVETENEVKMLALVNEERSKQNLKALLFDNGLTQVARNHGRDMFKRGYFSHDTPEGISPFDRLNNAGISYVVAGENLAFTPNLEIAHAGLMNSPGHRANILNPSFGKAGIGVIDGGIYGKMFVQEFTD